MTTGEKITEGRKKLGLTQQQFADELNVTRQAVSRWESDLAFPETDKLIKLSEMFGCSTDYLLKYNQSGADTSANGNGQRNNTHSSFNPFKWSFEYKSERQVFGMPLVHVNIGLGRVAKGFFSFGLVSVGVVSAGIVSLGVIAIGVLCLGLLAFASISAGLVAFGGVAIGFIAFGGLAVGMLAMGGCAAGAFAVGGFASGSFVAVG
ncbi:MAG: helix-turn-helix domain-containing protein, partial [Clostridia bacterium]|nr:helix-turn-helix domain-containing protein [Clostridia bacterium]